MAKGVFFFFLNHYSFPSCSKILPSFSFLISKSHLPDVQNNAVESELVAMGGPFHG